MNNVNPLSFKDNVFINPTTLPTESETNILSELEQLQIQEKELLATQEKIKILLNNINTRKQEIQAQIASEKAITAQPILAISEKLPEIAHSVLVIHTNQTIESFDSSGKWEHYAVSLLSKSQDKIEITSFPIDVKKYGEIKEIHINDGKKETALDSNHLSIQRLIKYLSTDFKTFRDGINQLDRNGSYSNKYHDFDCQRFSYYLNSGEEGIFGYSFGEVAQEGYRTKGYHKPIRCYSISAETASYGRNGEYRCEDKSLHHYVCIGHDLFVSKFGKNDIFFTSYQQILDAYFPEKFIKGTFRQEF